MAEKPTYLLIDSQVLPDVFLKVVRAKEMLARGKVKSAAMAARACGISRSAFYKYKDSVELFDRGGGSMITLYFPWPTSRECCRLFWAASMTPEPISSPSTKTSRLTVWLR